jgi:hypothetical protein
MPANEEPPPEPPGRTRDRKIRNGGRQLSRSDLGQGTFPSASTAIPGCSIDLVPMCLTHLKQVRPRSDGRPYLGRRIQM